MTLWMLIGLLSSFGSSSCLANDLKSVVASKPFPESYILAEIAAQILEENSVRVDRKFGLGATGIVFEAITRGEIVLYPEYSGTIAEAFLKNPALRELGKIQEKIGSLGLEMTDSLGFNNTYALAVRREFAEKNHLISLSDLARIPTARFGLTNEIMNRQDGYPGLARRYSLNPVEIHEMQHSLAYRALERGEIDVTDVYSTDATIKRLDLFVLKDDLGYFPNYQAVFLARRDWITKNAAAWKRLKQLEGKISAEEMVSLNAMVETDHRSFHDVAEFFLKGSNSAPKANWEKAHALWRRTLEHLRLVLISLGSSILVGLPLGVLAFYKRGISRIILNVSALIQTIPSLALLAFLIPLFGIGEKPAIFALFLYGLLPVVLNTYSGLDGVDPKLRESAIGLGLAEKDILRRVLLPLASPSILTGIRTSAVIGIGTATLAALIGAGGYGAPIMTGLALNDIPTLLEGAIPAACMALLAQWGLDRIAEQIIPAGLKRK
ncbi:MAG: ABC transporter permease subunit [Cryobacterium sp.]|nr:ABC transporter permease subunit [Oligoflexia bacterium]